MDLDPKTVKEMRTSKPLAPTPAPEDATKPPVAPEKPVEPAKPDATKPETSTPDKTKADAARELDEAVRTAPK